MTHPFEKSKLGKAPFSCTHVTENTITFPDGTSRAGGYCDYCFTGIRWEFWIKGSIAGAKQFKVGCDCVAKTGWGIEGFEKVRAEHTRARRQAGAKARREARLAEQAKEREQAQAQRLVASEQWRAEHAEVCTRLAAYEGDNSFLFNVKHTLALFGKLTDKQLEAVESCFAAIDRKESARAQSKHFGVQGEKVTLTVTVDRIVAIDGLYGRTYLNICRTTDGNVVTYKGKSGIAPQHETATIACKIKYHTAFDGICQTVIERPKVIDTVS